MLQYSRARPRHASVLARADARASQGFGFAFVNVTSHTGRSKAGALEPGHLTVTVQTARQPLSCRLPLSLPTPLCTGSLCDIWRFRQPSPLQLSASAAEAAALAKVHEAEVAKQSGTTGAVAAALALGNGLGTAVAEGALRRQRSECAELAESRG